MKLHDVPDWFAELMAALAECYPNHKLREHQVRAYYAVLRDIPEAQLRAAATRAPRTYTSFFPAAGDLRKLADPSPDDKAMAAWSGLQQAAGSVGAWQPLYCADYAAAAAVVAVFGSWPSFCEQCVDLPSGPWLARRQEFLAAYRIASCAPPVDARPVRLGGLCADDHAGAWAGLLGASGDVVAVRCDDQRVLASSTLSSRLLGDGDLTEL